MAQNKPKIAGLCLNIIQKYAIGTIGWSEFVMYRDMWSGMICSIDSPQTRLGESDRSLAVVPLQNGCYLYMNMSFDSHKHSNLKALSLHFYDTDQLLIRVDWSEKEMQTAKHAQPHWHFCAKTNCTLNASNVKLSESFEMFEKYETSSELEQKADELDFSRVHFYMAYKDNTTNLNFQDEKVLKNWLDYTLDYLNGQFMNLFKHMSV